MDEVKQSKQKPLAVLTINPRYGISREERKLIYKWLKSEAKSFWRSGYSYGGKRYRARLWRKP